MPYKLTDRDGWTRKGRDNACHWGEGVTHSGTGEGGLCGPGWIHYYDDALLAVLLNPAHADLVDPLLWECEIDGSVRSDRGLKFGAQHLTTLRMIQTPVVTMEQRARFGILCALEVCTDASWRTWADAWLSGKDRSRLGAAAAKAAAAAAKAKAAVEMAAEAWWSDADAVAADAAWSAAVAAARAAASVSAWAWAAAAAASPSPSPWAWAAASAAEVAVQASAPLDLPALARRAMEAA